MSVAWFVPRTLAMALSTRSGRRSTAQSGAPQSTAQSAAQSAVQPDVSSLSNIERLLLAQAVYELGANAWPSVAKLLTKHPLTSQRPKSFFTPHVSDIFGLPD
jgi:hypothetical protein